MTFPYGAPSEETYAQCDPLIVDLVRRINADGRVQTVQSCEGHPWPMLELVGPVGELVGIACMLLRALPEKWQLVTVPIIHRCEAPEPPLGSNMNTVRLLRKQRGIPEEDLGSRWRFTVIPSSQEPGAIAAARAVLGSPWK